MAISPARTAAFDILMQAEQQETFASELLHAPRFERLSSADHRLATELVMGVLRWRALLDKKIAEQSSKPLEKLDLEVLAALRLGAYQVIFLDRIPQRAAVHESVELVKRARKHSAATFANAVLRKIANKREVRAISDARSVSELAEASAHPEWLVQRWSAQFGFEAARQVCTYDQHAPESAIRLSDASVEAELAEEDVKLTPGRILRSARVLSGGDITHSRAFRRGAAVIQDEASQLVGLLVGKGERILDCCAAPGGKTRIMAEGNPNGRIVAADLHPHRARLLRNLVGAKNVEVIAADAIHLPVTVKFDRVLADVPCSGTGTLARNPEIKWRLTAEDLRTLQSRQTAILESAMRQLAPGGRVVYSTCSLEREENEEVLERVLAANPVFRLRECRAELERLQQAGELAWQDLQSITRGPYLRTIPGVHPCDGFFAAIVQRD